VSAAILDIEHDIIWCWESYNFDHPEGLAIRSVTSVEGETEEEIYLDDGGIDKTVLYQRDGKILPDLDNMYSNSSWDKLDMKSDFEELRDYIKYTKNHANCKPYYDNINDTRNISEDLYKNKQYAESIESYRVLLEIPNLHSHYGFMSADMSTDICVKYNMACCYALLNRTIDAMDLLKEIEPKLSDVFISGHMRQDSDFENLKELDEFKSMLDIPYLFHYNLSA